MPKVSFKQKISLILFGVFLCVLSVEIGLRIAGMMLLSSQRRRNTVSVDKKNECRIVCLGESTTVWGNEESWPSQLERILNERNARIRFKVINKGRPTIDTSYILLTLEENLDKYAPDIVITMIGVNDWVGTIPYEDSVAVKIKLFLRRFRVYNLARTLYMHILNKVDELRLNKSLNRDRKERGFLRNKTIFKNVLQLNHQDTGAYTDLGHSYNSQRKYQKAEEMFKKALELDLRDSSAYNGLGSCYFGQGKYQDAEEMFRKALAINPDNDVFCADLGHFYNAQNRCREAEEMFKKAIALNPDNASAYNGLGDLYANQNRCREAEEMFKKAIALNPDNASAYDGLANYYKNQGKYKEAEAMFQKAIDPAFRNDGAYSNLGSFYYDQGRHEEAEFMFRKAIEINPNNTQAYVGIGKCYREQDRSGDAMEMAKRAIEIDSRDKDGYVLLGNSYFDQRRYPEAETAFKNALEIDPTFEPTYSELGRCYREQGKLKEIEELAKRILKEKVRNDRLYGFVAVSYKEQGKQGKAKEYFRLADQFRLRYYNPATRHNYQILKEIVTQRGIRLVCMQYPLRSIEPLKKLFDSTEGIIFVENKKIFEDALRHDRYEDYFADNFGGEFGHGTPLGNRLIAENVANVILKEVFNK